MRWCRILCRWRSQKSIVEKPGNQKLHVQFETRWSSALPFSATSIRIVARHGPKGHPLATADRPLVFHKSGFGHSRGTVKRLLTVGGILPRDQTIRESETNRWSSHGNAGDFSTSVLCHGGGRV